MQIKNQILKKAIEMARKSTVKKSRMGAVIFTRKGGIIACGNNRRIDGKKAYTIHAEQDVISRAMRKIKLKDFSRYFLLVVRINRKNDELVISRPCKKCTELLRWLKMGVYFVDRKGKVVEGWWYYTGIFLDAKNTREDLIAIEKDTVHMSP